MSGVKRVGKNTSLVFIARMTDILSAVATIAVLTRYLGAEAYGKYSLIIALVISLTCFSQSLPKIIVREVSRNKSSAGHFLGSAILFTAFLSIGIFFLSIGAVFWLNLDKSLVTILAIAVLSEIIRIFSSSFISIFIAMERMGYDTLVTISQQLVFFTLLIPVAVLGLDIMYVFLAMITGSLVGFTIASVTCLRKFKVRPEFGNWRHYLRFTFREVLPAGISFIIFQLARYVDVFVLKLFKGFEAVAFFQAPYGVILKFLLIPQVIVMAIAPLLSRLVVADPSHAKLGYVYTRILKYSAIVIVPVTAFGFIFADRLVPLFFGGKFLNAVLPFRILICALPILFLDFFSDVFFVSIGKQKIIAYNMLVCFITNLILDLVLVSRYSYIGASVASLVAPAVLFILNLYFLSRHINGIALSEILTWPGKLADEVFQLTEIMNGY